MEWVWFYCFAHVCTTELLAVFLLVSGHVTVCARAAVSALRPVALRETGHGMSHSHICHLLPPSLFLFPPLSLPSPLSSLPPSLPSLSSHLPFLPPPFPPTSLSLLSPIPQNAVSVFIRLGFAHKKASEEGLAHLHPSWRDLPSPTPATPHPSPLTLTDVPQGTTSETNIHSPSPGLSVEYMHYRILCRILWILSLSRHLRAPPSLVSQRDLPEKSRVSL